MMAIGPGGAAEGDSRLLDAALDVQRPPQKPHVLYRPGEQAVARGADQHRVELLVELLDPLLAERRGDDDEDTPATLRPALGKDEAGFDGLAETNLVGENHSLGQG